MKDKNGGKYERPTVRRAGFYCDSFLLSGHEQWLAPICFHFITYKIEPITGWEPLTCMFFGLCV